VLQAAVLAQNRETFVLDMGEQLKVLDLAKNLIRLSGFVPDEDIKIAFIGLRPGEKLVEELVGEGEALEPSEIAKIFRVRWPETPDLAAIVDDIDSLVAAAVHGHVDETIERLIGMVPTFTRERAALSVSAGNRGAAPPSRASRARTSVLTDPVGPARLSTVKSQPGG
jgi:FlaA1/EpsC-like NDP-sugar epimerase